LNFLPLPQMQGAFKAKSVALCIFVRFAAVCAPAGAGFAAVRRGFCSGGMGGVACSMMNLAALNWRLGEALSLLRMSPRVR